MTRLDKQKFQAWAYDDLLTNTTRGVLAEYIVATALGIDEVKRIEWHGHDLDVDLNGVQVGVEVKSAAYVQSWKQTKPSVIEFGIGPAKGWNAHTNTYAPSAKRSADVYIFCLLNGTIGEQVDPLDVKQWTFYVMPTTELDRKIPKQKKIRLGPLKALGPKECAYGQLKAAIQAAAEFTGHLDRSVGGSG